MNMGEAVQTVLFEKYATFSGRARRAEFWWFALATILVSVVLSLLGMLTGLVWVFDLIDSLISLAILIPSLAVGARRLHDTDRTGWWQAVPLFFLLGVLVFGAAAFTAADFSGTKTNFGVMGWAMAITGILVVISFIVLIVWWAMPGNEGPNRYGDDPLGGGDAEVFS